MSIIYIYMHCIFTHHIFIYLHYIYCIYVHYFIYIYRVIYVIYLQTGDFPLPRLTTGWSQRQERLWSLRVLLRCCPNCGGSSISKWGPLTMQSGSNWDVWYVRFEPLKWTCLGDLSMGHTGTVGIHYEDSWDQKATKYFFRVLQRITWSPIWCRHRPGFRGDNPIF